MKIHSLVLVLVTLATAACSNSDVMFPNQRTSAPTNANDLGVVIDGAQASDVQDLVKAYPDAKVRVVSQPHGIYEIFGLTHQQVREKFPNNSEPNHFTSFRKNKHSLMLDAMAGPAGLQVGNLKACVTAKIGPTAVLSVDQPMAALNGATIQLGQSVKVNGLKSSGNKSVKGAINSVIAVALPDTAPKQELTQNGNTYEFTPDTMGLYQIFLVVQDSNASCSVDAIQFIVTANRPYNGPNAQALNLDLSKFTHLAMVHAQDAWKISQGSGIVIAVVDTGVDYNHPSLAPQIYINTKEIPANGIDDDKNGYIDDYVGYDFANQDPYPYDDDSHGTHVSGLAAAKQFGLAPQAKILPVKTMTPAGGDDATIAAGIRYAVDRGANIINLSVGSATPGGQPSQVMVTAMQYAQNKGVLVVSAAGNGDDNGKGIDIDQNPEFPASLVMDNNLAVAAFDSTEDLASYSNYGIKDVGVCAPGGGTTNNDFMYSAAYENTQGMMFIGMSGTSMATPVVAGIAADVWSKQPKLTYKEVKAILLSAGANVPSLAGKITSGKHIDALSAVQSPSAQAASPVLN